MGGTWFDWLIVLVGIIVLLPRLFAYVVNTSVILALQRRAQSFGLSLDCEIGSISFRQLAGIRLRMGRWRLPQHPNLYASVELSIESLCLQLCKKRPITCCMAGAKFVVQLSEETAQERAEREKHALEYHSSNEAARQQQQQANVEDRKRKLHRAEISTRSLAAAAEAFETSVVTATAAAAQSTPIPILSNFVHGCILKLSQWVAISVQRTEITLKKGDVAMSVCDIGFNVWASDGSSNSNRQFHMDLNGFAVRFERLSTHCAFRSQAGYRADDELLRVPPLLQMLSTEITLDFQVQRCIPVGLDGIDIQCGGLEISLDPSLQLEAAQQAAVEFVEQIREMRIHLPPQAQAALNGSSLPPPSSSRANHNSANADDPNTCEEFYSQRRQFMLRFLPKQTKLNFEHFKVELIQRDESAGKPEEKSAAKAAKSKKTAAAAAAAAAELRKRATAKPALCPVSSFCDTGSTAVVNYQPFPIMNSLLLRFNKLAVLSSVKTAYPVCDSFGEDNDISPDDNNISSIDWSLNMAGPSVWMSQQGMVHPRLDVEYCKLTGHSSANFAAAGSTPGHSHHTKHSSLQFPLSAPLQASAAAFSSPLSGPHSNSPPTQSFPARKTRPRSNSFKPVDSLFHPTTAYRPQTVHALTFVCVSLRVHTFPSSAEWSQYVIQTIWRGEEFFKALPLPKPPVPGINLAALNMSPLHTPVGATPHSASTPAANSSASSSTSSQTPTVSKRPLMPIASITSPESYLRQINSQQRATATPKVSSSMQPPFPQFPFAVPPQANGPGVPSSLGASVPSAVPSNQPTTPTTFGDTPIASPPVEPDDPYKVQSAITINVKVVDLHLAVYPKLSDTLPLCHISISEISFRYDLKPSQLVHVLHAHSSHSDPKSRLATSLENSTILTAGASSHKGSNAQNFILQPAAERIEIVLSGLIGSLPQEVRNPYALSFHASESMHVPGRFFQLHTATLIVDKAESDILFNADGLNLRWSTGVLLMGPAMVGLMFDHIPKRPSRSSSSSSFVPAPGFVDPKSVEIKFVRGTVTNVTVDFPYVLEFKSDSSKRTGPAAAVPSDIIRDVGSKSTSSSSSSSTILDIAASPSSATSPGFPEELLPPGSIGSSSSAGFIRSPSPASAAAAAAANPSLQHRPTSLFTYKCNIINLDVNILENAWSLLLYQSNCLSEGDTFLSVFNASISGAERSAHAPKSFNVTGDQIIGSWRPALQLGLFKVVKDCVAAAINFKYGLCEVVPSWKKFCLEQDRRDWESGNDDEAKRLEKEVIRAAAMAELIDVEAFHPKTGVDYNNDPMVQLLGPKAAFLAAFREWYNHLRARHLPEPFMYVTLSTTNLLFDAALNREETLGCVIRLQRFSSDFVPHQFSFIGVEIDFMKKPIVCVSEVHLNRVGLPDVKEVAMKQVSTLPTSVTANNNNGINGTPPIFETEHPLMYFTEEHNLLANYLDISLEIKQVRVEIAPNLQIGSVLDLIHLKVQALVAAILDLPTLNTLSLRTNGPGYLGPPDVAPPAVALSIQNCQFEVVDEPFESWLQHLHLLWLDERAEQERRRALLRLKIETMQKDGQFDINANKDTIIQGMYNQLSEWNSRSYHARVEALKQSFRGGDSLKKAPLLNLTISSMLMAIGLEGSQGSFYDSENVLRVIRNRKQQEDEGWNEMAKRRQKQERMHTMGNNDGKNDDDLNSPDLSSPFQSMGSRERDDSSNLDLHRPSSSPAIIANIATDIPDALLLPATSLNAPAVAISPVAQAPTATSGGHRIAFLSARYFKLSLSEIQVRLRNFPLPLFSCVEASMFGHSALVQVKYDGPTQAPAAAPASKQQEKATGDSKSDANAANERAAVSIGGVHTVAVETRYRPFQMFYDIEGSVNQAAVSFSPCFLYTLRDIFDAMDRVVPPLPELHPIQPIPGMIGLSGLGLTTARKGERSSSASSSGGSTAASQSQEIDPVNYIHLFRGIAHGRFSLSVKDTEVKLLASNDPYEATKYLKLCAGLCKIGFEKSIFKVEVQQINAIQIPARPKQPFLMELPQLELHTTVMWVCSEVPMHSHGHTHTHNSQPQSSPVSVQSTPQRPLRHILSNIAPGGGTNLNEAFGSIPSATSSLPNELDVSITGPSDGEMQHVCNMHLSLSVYFSSHNPYVGPLSVTLHSGSLASLVQFAQVYSTIPPLPFPRRTALTKIDADTCVSLFGRGTCQHSIGVYPSPIPVNSPVSASSIEDSASPEPSSSPEVGGRSIFRQPSSSLDPTDPMNKNPGQLVFSRSPSHRSSLSVDEIQTIANRVLNEPAQSSFSNARQNDVATTGNTRVFKSRVQRVELHGLYLERILLEKIHLTIWEGADLGPARGLRLSMEHVYLALELQEESKMTSLDQNLNLKGNKVCFPFKKVAHQEVVDPYAIYSQANCTSVKVSPSLSTGIQPSPASGTMGPSCSPPAAPVSSSQMIFWSLSNTVCGISKLSGLLVYNDRWRELADLDAESSQKIDSIFGGSRVVVYTYENQRYTLGLGWSAKNLLPTDRGAWTNDNGSQKILKDDVKLPSDDWEWENDWHLDFQLRRSGEVDEESWEYSHDFPRKYSRVRTWYCNVRRRRWIRVRKLKNQKGAPGEDDGSSPTPNASQSPPSVDPNSERSKKRPGLRSENTENFVLSLARVTIQQKQYQHSAEIYMLMLDKERALFRLITAPIFSRCMQHASKSAVAACANALQTGIPPTVAELSKHSGSVCHNHSQSGDKLHSTSLLNFFHIPAPTSNLPVVADPTTPAPGTVHNVHQLDAVEFAEAQRAQDALKLVHSATSSIVTVGGDLGMNPTLMMMDDDGEDTVAALDATADEDEIAAMRVEEDEEAEEQLNEQFEERKKGLKRHTSCAKTKVRFNQECVLDSVRAERRRKSLTLESNQRASSPTSLTRSDLVAVHSLRLCDFKILLTTEIRSTLVTLVDQYVATIMDLMHKSNRDQERQKKHPGKVKIQTDAEKANNEGVEVFERSMADVLEETADSTEGNLSREDSSLQSPPSPRSISRVADDLLDFDASTSGNSTRSTRALSNASTTNGTPFSFNPPPSASMGTLKSMDDFLATEETDDDESKDSVADVERNYLIRCAQLQLPDRGRGRAMSSAAALNSYRPDAISIANSNFPHDNATGNASIGGGTTIQSSPQNGIGGISTILESTNEVSELFLIEIINPQLNVHSEETKGRILFMTHKLAVHGRLHFKTEMQVINPPANSAGGSSSTSTNSAHTASSPLTSTLSAPLLTNRARAGTDGGVRMSVIPPSRGSSVVPVTKLDKLAVSVIVDQLQGFVAPTDVDVNAGVVWLSSATAGILKSIMLPSSFMCTVALRPSLPAFSIPRESHDEDRTPTSSNEPSVSGTKGGYGGSQPQQPTINQIPRSRAPHLSKATQHMSHHHLDGGHATAYNKSWNAELHSIDLNLPELVLQMDSYQFALFLDVMKTITNPLPIQAINHSIVDASVDNEDDSGSSDVDEAEDDSMSLAELKNRANNTKSQLTILEWEMRHVEWILAGLGNNTKNVNTPGSTNNSTVELSVNTSSSNNNNSFSSALNPLDTDSYREDVTPMAQDSTRNASNIAFNTWLQSTTSKYRRGYDSSNMLNGGADIVSKFHELLREHSKISSVYLKHMLAIRLRELEQKPQAQPQNIALTVFLSKICFHLRKQEKCFLNLYVEGVNAALHLYDDASADLSLEVGSFGARNTMANYLNPNNKEYAWAEIVTPLILPSATVSSASLTGPGCTTAPGSMTSLMEKSDAANDMSKSDEMVKENIHSSDMLISIQGVKREEFNVHTNTVMTVIQHLELNFFPLQIRCTYDTLAAMTEFFVQDQEKYINVNTNSRFSDDDATNKKAKKQYEKYKSKFLPSGGHILEMDQAIGGLQSQKDMNASSGASSAHTKHGSISIPATGGKSKGLLDAIKHSRVVSVAKEFYHAHTSSPANADLYENEPTSASVNHASSPLASARSKRSQSEDVGAGGSFASFDFPSARDSKDTKAKSSANNKQLSKKINRARGKVFQFVYVRFGSTMVNVSYWGNKQNNIEDFQGLKIKFRQIVFQKKLWTMAKFNEALKKEALKNLLSQVSATLGSFISYKLGFRPANDVVAPTSATNPSSSSSSITSSFFGHSSTPSNPSDSEKKKGLMGRLGANAEEDSDAEDNDAAAYFDPSPDSSALLAHFDSELAVSAISQASAKEESSAVRSLLFGEKKSKGKKMMESLASVFGSSNKEKEAREEQRRASSASISSSLQPSPFAGINSKSGISPSPTPSASSNLVGSTQQQQSSAPPTTLSNPTPSPAPPSIPPRPTKQTFTSNLVVPKRQ